jgi:phytoene dehydrogenase-like protein
MTQSKQDNAYDVILVGSGMGSLVAGILLSRGKLSVLLLQEKGYSSSFIREGYRFVPFSNFSEKILRAPSLKRLFQTLALQPPVRPNGEGESRGPTPSGSRQKVPFQVILPEARIDLFPDHSELQGEWKREFPQEVAKVEEFHREMTNHRNRLMRERGQGKSSLYFPLRRSLWLNRFLPSEPSARLAHFSRPFESFIKLQFMAWGSLYPSRSPASLAAHLLSLDQPGDWIWNLDLEELKVNLLSEFLRSGGKIEEVEGVERVSKEWMRGFSLRLGSSEKIIHSKYLVVHSPFHRITEFTAQGRKRLSTWSQRIKPKFVLFPLFAALKEKVIPVGMKDLLISLEDLEKPYPGGNLLLLAFSTKGDETRAPQGRRALTVESLVSWEKYNERWDTESVDEHRAGVMKHLRHLIPFLEDHVEFIDSQHGDELIRHWSYPHFMYESLSAFPWREGVIPTRPFRNLYCVGKESFPHLGLEGELLGSWMIAHQILKKYS